MSTQQKFSVKPGKKVIIITDVPTISEPIYLVYGLNAKKILHWVEVISMIIVSSQSAAYQNRLLL